jgi:hypothetical protein
MLSDPARTNHLKSGDLPHSRDQHASPNNGEAWHPASPRPLYVVSAALSGSATALGGLITYANTAAMANITTAMA